MAKTVILIDDDPDDLDLMKQAIGIVDPNLLCTSFLYPEEAPRVLLSIELMMLPDYIFIDINMPRLTGDKCLKALRKDQNFDDIVIALYSTSMPDTVAEASKISGANQTFKKPVRLNRCLATWRFRTYGIV